MCSSDLADDGGFCTIRELAAVSVLMAKENRWLRTAGKNDSSLIITREIF